ncbi:hypothetical protein [Paenibacillus jiagnxiensis]|uniref:hypothetical protein n=1 Tax=Paenibacillus jiagnxiensis TaxID=3228926 RepID=UPI0033B9A181
MTILTSAINHGFPVDSVLDHFKGKIGEAIEICSKSGEAIYITKFFYTLFSYHLKTKPHQVALHNILQAIEGSDNYKDVSQYKVSVSVKDIIAVCSYGPYILEKQTAFG